MTHNQVRHSKKISKAQVKKFTVVQQAGKIFIESTTRFAKMTNLYEVK
jgi:hypothetical protein